MSDKITVRKQPCGSCPYRRDVPSGVWAENEYQKLPAYDGSTVEQLVNGAHGVFLCHTTPDKLCAGWVGCHSMDDNLALRLEAQRGTEIDPAVFTYESPIPLWGSGAEACAHGMAEIDDPPEEAVKTIEKLAPVVAARPKRFRRRRS
jgi:hypothetical protein